MRESCSSITLQLQKSLATLLTDPPPSQVLVLANRCAPERSFLSRAAPLAMPRLVATPRASLARVWRFVYIQTTYRPLLPLTSDPRRGSSEPGGGSVQVQPAPGTRAELVFCVVRFVSGGSKHSLIVLYVDSGGKLSSPKEPPETGLDTKAALAVSPSSTQ